MPLSRPAKILAATSLTVATLGGGVLVATAAPSIPALPQKATTTKPSSAESRSPWGAPASRPASAPASRPASAPASRPASAPAAPASSRPATPAQPAPGMVGEPQRFTDASGHETVRKVFRAADGTMTVVEYDTKTGVSARRATGRTARC